MMQSKTSKSFWLTTLALAMGLGLAGCHSKPAQQEKHYPITGTVSAIDAEHKAVTLDHEAIPGYMQAMEMEFKIADPQFLQGVVVGDQVQGELTVRDSDSVITGLKKKSND